LGAHNGPQIAIPTGWTDTGAENGSETLVVELAAPSRYAFQPTKFDLTSPMQFFPGVSAQGLAQDQRRRCRQFPLEHISAWGDHGVQRGR